MIDDLIHERHVGELLADHTNEPRQAGSAKELSDPTLWSDRVREALAQRSDTALDVAEDAVRACPGEFELLLLAALAALAAGQSVRAHAFLKRHQKRYVPRGSSLSLRPRAGSSALVSCCTGYASGSWRFVLSRGA